MHSSLTTTILAVTAGFISPVIASPVAKDTSPLPRKIVDATQGTLCGIFATADKRNFIELQYALRQVGGDCKVPARTCMRVSCGNTTGIYVCNDNDYEVTIPCNTVAQYASNIGSTCCTAPYFDSNGLSGQSFSNEGWNVCVAYANCNHSPTQDAPSIFGLPGINGECKN